MAAIVKSLTLYDEASVLTVLQLPAISFVILCFSILLHKEKIKHVLKLVFFTVSHFHQSQTFENLLKWTPFGKIPQGPCKLLKSRLDLR